MSSVNSV